MLRLLITLLSHQEGVSGVIQNGHGNQHLKMVYVWLHVMAKRRKPVQSRPAAARRNIAKAQMSRLGKRGEHKKNTLLRRI
ncbi:hypothetical protein LCGC14_1201420 [marine sediment metagenome]|uniref:Uncharacterized protein n=1 Tax=marine sediment metagenome TaxID=412755 RepID=A0A0F9LGQ0_9ZZZZ